MTLSYAGAASSKFSIISTTKRPRSKRSGRPLRTGDHLVQSGALSPDDLFRGLALQRHEDAKLGEILRALDLVSRKELQCALSAQSGLAWIDLRTLTAASILLNICAPEVYLTHSFVPISNDGSIVTVALADPNKQSYVSDILAKQSLTAHFVLADKDQIHAAVARAHKTHLVNNSVQVRPSQSSCRAILSFKSRVIFSLLAFVLLCLLVTTGWFYTGLFLWIAATLIANTALKAVCVMASLWPKPKTAERLKARQSLPKVSILIPLLNEVSILERLIKRMEVINYPSELLDIKLVIEASDTATLTHINQSNLPSWITPLVVPNGEIQTKPRAMNYALDFCAGSVIGIFDAEDAPEADQVYKAVRHLQAGDDKLACVQSILDYYNSGTNWLSRCFTIEYAILFRVILPGLQALSLPIPLGGTSVYFKRDALESLGRWDAHNVTEDADLGILLYRKGYRCEMLESTTYEEANFRLVPWIKQRSRWLKGFVITWLTHIKNPIQLYRDVGLPAFIAFNIMFFGAVSAYLAAPIVLPLWLISFGITLPIYAQIPPSILHTAVYGFIATEVFLFCLAIIAIRQPHLRGHWPSTLTLFLYWPIGAFAAYKAVFELIFAPSYWDKTSHGINDQNFDKSIQNLTKSTLNIHKDFKSLQ